MQAYLRFAKLKRAQHVREALAVITEFRDDRLQPGVSSNDMRHACHLVNSCMWCCAGDVQHQGSDRHAGGHVHDDEQPRGQGWSVVEL